MALATKSSKCKIDKNIKMVKMQNTEKVKNVITNV